MNLRRLRLYAISHALFHASDLRSAIERMGFVQADPIRAPARAQDLILRQRVDGYRAGDLERDYPALEIEEDLLYAYGFLPRSVWSLLHPRAPARLTRVEETVLDTVRRLGAVHPRDLESKRVTNAWGGWSKATTRALDHLQYRGLLRIARRDNGIRVYEAARPITESADRATQVALRLADILAPAPEKNLQATLTRVLAHIPRAGTARRMLAELIARGALVREAIDGVSYVWPTTHASADEAPRRVRLLAPFDPLVWDRRRFEHLWGWAYRFEAYTPVKKRVRGYYALPMLWLDRMVGWANVSRDPRFDVELGFVGARPRERDFRRALADELARLEAFL